MELGDAQAINPCFSSVSRLKDSILNFRINTLFKIPIMHFPSTCHVFHHHSAHLVAQYLFRYKCSLSVKSICISIMQDAGDTANSSMCNSHGCTCSVQNLELVESLHIQAGPQKKRGCLFEMLKTTKTVGG